MHRRRCRRCRFATALEERLDEFVILHNRYWFFGRDSDMDEEGMEYWAWQRRDPDQNFDGYMVRVDAKPSWYKEALMKVAHRRPRATYVVHRRGDEREDVLGGPLASVHCV